MSLQPDVAYRETLRSVLFPGNWIGVSGIPFLEKVTLLAGKLDKEHPRISFLPQILSVS